MALPPGPVPRLAGGVEPVAALARQGNLGGGDAGPRARDPAPAEPEGRPDDGDDRRADGEGRARRPEARKGKRVFTPLRPLYKVENAFARLGMWRRLWRCYEQTALGAQTWLEVACVAYLCGRLRVEPT